MSERPYPRQFWLLCAGSFFFFGSFNMVVPELPSIITRLGGAEYKGLIISLFTLTAMLSRPFSGRLADTVGRVPVMIFGSLVCIVCSFWYPFVATVNGFLLLRFFHGFSTGFSPTGFTAYVADIVPAGRRGEAMGLLSTFGTLGMAGSPALGGWLQAEWSLDVTFYASAVFAMVAVAIFLSVTETLHNRQRFRASHLAVTWSDLYEPRVLVPCVIMVMTSFSFGTMLTVVPDLSDSLGLANRGMVFMVFTLSSVAIRIIAGQLSDRFGRPAILKFSTVLIAVSMAVTGFADQPYMLYLGGILYGVANGINSPTLFAWATDLGDEQAKGRAFAFLYISLEFGIGAGALASGWFLNGPAPNFPAAFSSGCILGLLALIYLLLKTKGRNLRNSTPVVVN
ncbi:MAG: MFS transporter [Bacteroidota bacterium]